MKQWKKFEEECVKYLNDNFRDYAIFELKGGSNSTLPDIFVQTKTNKEFYIEAKDVPAQCGQFVAFPDYETQTFVLSDKNKSIPNKYTNLILEYMSQNFEVFEGSGKAGTNIQLSEDIFVGWITTYYKNKGVKLFITDDFTIVPIEKLGEYFHASCTYRAKKSGSSDVGKRYMKDVLAFIKNNNFGVTDYHEDGKKLFVYSSNNIHGTRFMIDNQEYMFSKREEKYAVRRLSNTNNRNIIFSIDLKTSKPGTSDDEFITYLK